MPAQGPSYFFMYFIQPTRDIPYLDQVIAALPSVQMINIEDLDLYDPTIIAIADAADYLAHKWALPTIVLAFENEGACPATGTITGKSAIRKSSFIWPMFPATASPAAC